MTRSMTRGNWRRTAARAVACGALAVGTLFAPLSVGIGTANADVLDDVYAEYATGAGGGQVSKLVEKAMKLRALGFRPTKGHLDKIEQALAYRPNQKPLIEALETTIAYQRKRQAQADNSITGTGPFTIGINQLPPGVPADPHNPNTAGVFISPGGGVQQQLTP